MTSIHLPIVVSLSVVGWGKAGRGQSGIVQTWLAIVEVWHPPSMSLYKTATRLNFMEARGQCFHGATWLNGHSEDAVWGSAGCEMKGRFPCERKRVLGSADQTRLGRECIGQRGPTRDSTGPSPGQEGVGEEDETGGEDKAWRR